MAKPVDPKEFKGVRRVLLNIQPYVAGGCGACFAAVCIHPIDLVKVRIQISPDKKVSAIKITQDVIKNEGLSRLYAGLSASIMRQAVYGTARLGLHRSFSEMIKGRNNGKISLGQKTVCGLISGMLAGIIGNPFDLALVRMQADGVKPLDQRRGYKNAFHAVYRIAKDEGILTWWRGCFPMILRAMAMNAGMLAAFDQSKEFFLKRFGSGLITDLSASAVAGFSCAFFSLPFDLMKTRLMNMKPNAEGVMPYKGVTDVFLKILRNEGPLAYWKGFITYYCRCAPHSMIILITMESITRTYERICFGKVISK